MVLNCVLLLYLWVSQFSSSDEAPNTVPADVTTEGERMDSKGTSLLSSRQVRRHDDGDIAATSLLKETRSVAMPVALVKTLYSSIFTRVEGGVELDSWFYKGLSLDGEAVQAIEDAAYTHEEAVKALESQALSQGQTGEIIDEEKIDSLRAAELKLLQETKANLEREAGLDSNVEELVFEYLEESDSRMLKSLLVQKATTDSISISAEYLGGARRSYKVYDHDSLEDAIWRFGHLIDLDIYRANAENSSLIIDTRSD